MEVASPALRDTSSIAVASASGGIITLVKVLRLEFHVGTIDLPVSPNLVASCSFAKLACVVKLSGAKHFGVTQLASRPLAFPEDPPAILLASKRTTE